MLQEYIKLGIAAGRNFQAELLVSDPNSIRWAHSSSPREIAEYYHLDTLANPGEVF